MAGEISLLKPFLKETKTNSLLCLKSEVLSRVAQGSDRTKDLSNLSDLSRVGARAGITTEATLSRPSLASWFLDRKLVVG